MRLFAQNETEMKIVKTNQLEKARSLKVGDVSIVEFEDYNKYRSFTVQLAHYNADLGRKRSLYVLLKLFRKRARKQESPRQQ